MVAGFHAGIDLHRAGRARFKNARRSGGRAGGRGDRSRSVRFALQAGPDTCGLVRHCHRLVRVEAATMNLWMIVIFAGALTFLTRLSFISLLADWDMPPVVRQALHFVPPAVLSAIAFPELLLKNGGLALSADNYRLIAGVVAIALAWKMKTIMPTIAAGMAVLWLLQVIA